MTDTRRYPSRLAAYQAGREAGLREAREQTASDGQGQGAGAEGPAPMTLADIRAGKFTHDELIARKAEVDELLSGGEAA